MWQKEFLSLSNQVYHLKYLNMKYWRKFKIWLLDFDKKETFWGLFPLIAFGVFWLGLFIFMCFKFRNQIWAKFFALCFLVNYSTYVQAKCAYHTDNDIFKESKFIVEAVVLKRNFDNESLNDCGIEKKNLNYTVKVASSLGNELKPGEYSISYTYQCGQKPSDIVFEVGRNYLLAIKQVSRSNLTLVGTTCGWWGWSSLMRKKLSSSLNEFCASKERKVYKLIESSKNCKIDSDCDYVSYSTQYVISMKCHNFVNKNKIQFLDSEIKSLSGSVCKDPPLMLCKAPLKEFIKCKNMKCSFP